MQKQINKKKQPDIKKQIFITRFTKVPLGSYRCVNAPMADAVKLTFIKTALLIYNFDILKLKVKKDKLPQTIHR